MPLLGQLALWLALLLALWGVATGYAGAKLDRPDLQESARRATVAFAGAMFTALAALAVGAWRQDFHLAYIASHADLTLRTRDVWAVLLDGAAGQWLVAGCALAAGLAAGTVGCSLAGAVAVLMESWSRYTARKRHPWGQSARTGSGAIPG